MKQHKPYEDMLILFFYDELKPGDRKIFERHLETCTECKNNLKSLAILKASLEQVPKAVPSTTLIERANMRIMNQIRQSQRFKFSSKISIWIDDIQESLASVFARPRYQLIAIGITFILGVFIGKLWLSSGLRNDPGMLANFVNYQASLTKTEKENLQKNMANYLLHSGEVEIADLIQGTPTDDGSGIVEVNIKIERDFAVRGGLDDPTILNMLRYSALHDNDKARRLRAIKLLSKTPQNHKNESVMIVVVLNDLEKELREQALETLTSYTINDQILDIYKTIALRDGSNSIRSIAMEQLYNNADDTVIPVLALIASNDENETIRDTAQKYLDEIVKGINQSNTK